MGNIASIHIEPSKDNNTVHNDRTIAPDYLLKHKSLGVEVDNKSDVADAIYTAKLNSATEAYTNRVGQKIQAKNIKWSAVVNVNENTTMDDLKRVASFLEEKYGWQCYQIAIHRDEGHIDKDSGETIYNLHAHLELLMLDKNGIYRFKKRDFGKKKMAELQTEIANLLKLERGLTREERLEMVAEKLGVNVADIKQRKNEKHDAYVNRIKALAKTKGFEDFNIFKEIKGSVRQTHQQYKQQKRSEDKLKTELKEAKTTVNELNKIVLSLADQKKQVEAERIKYKEQGDHIAEEYRALQALNKTLHTQEELDNALAYLRKQYEERIKAKDSKISQLQKDNLELCNDLTDLSDKYTELSNQAQKQIETIKDNPRTLTDEEIENLPRVKQLIEDNNNLQKFYAVTPDDFSFRVTADDLKTKKFGLFHEETAQGTADRINHEIRKHINPIIQNNKALSKQNKDLTEKVKDLDSKNTSLSKKVKALTDEVKEIYQTLCIPFKDTIKERLNSFKGWLNDFLFGEEEKLDEIRADIFRKNDTSENTEKKLDIELGFIHDKSKTQEKYATRERVRR